MSFLSNLPSFDKNTFSSFGNKKIIDKPPQYTPIHDKTLPPSDQIITTEKTHILLRYIYSSEAKKQQLASNLNASSSNVPASHSINAVNPGNLIVQVSATEQPLIQSNTSSLNNSNYSYNTGNTTTATTTTTTTTTATTNNNSNNSNTTMMDTSPIGSSNSNSISTSNLTASSSYLASPTINSIRTKRFGADSEYPNPKQGRFEKGGDDDNNNNDDNDNGNNDNNDNLTKNQ